MDGSSEDSAHPDESEYEANANLHLIAGQSLLPPSVAVVG